jgi:Flp pilus assembly protein TadD
MGIALFELNRKQEAVRHMEEAVRLDPTDGDARTKLQEFRTSTQK